MTTFITFVSALTVYNGYVLVLLSDLFGDSSRTHKCILIIYVTIYCFLQRSDVLNLTVLRPSTLYAKP